MSEPFRTVPIDPPAADPTPPVTDGPTPSPYALNLEGMTTLIQGPAFPSGERPQAGSDVLGYVVTREIGRGGMGVVYRAKDLALDREVAVKVLGDLFAPGSAVSGRFVDEARITARLQHPGIPAVHQVGTLSDGRPFLAMKLIQGRTLSDLFRDRPDLSADRGK